MYVLAIEDSTWNEWTGLHFELLTDNKEEDNVWQAIWESNNVIFLCN